MPVFEYKCNECNKKFEFFHKSSNNIEAVNCPECKSSNNKKLLSSFSAQVNSGSGFNPANCHGGSCGMAPAGGCANGMCGLN